MPTILPAPCPAPASLVPAGRLRVTINLGNAVLASRHADGTVGGISVDIAAILARRLGVETEHLVVDAAREAVAAIREDRADLGFFAADPERGRGVAFSAPYVLIEGCWLVPDASPIRTADEVDRPGHRIVVAEGSAYDLFLTRRIAHAQLVRVATSQAVVGHFLATDADVAAGVRQQLEADRARRAGLRLVEPPFMAIGQAAGVAESRGPETARWLRDAIETIKASGELAAILHRHGAGGLTIAPPAGAGDAT